MKGIIYSYRSPSGKYYIGKTMRPRIRQQQHRDAVLNGKKNLFYNAVRKYGWDSFVYICELVIEAPTKAELNQRLNEMEIYYIEKYDSYNNGYNMTPGGDGGPINAGRVMPYEERKKHRDAMVGRVLTEEHKQKIREANKGKHGYLKECHYTGPRNLSEETKRKMSESHKGLLSGKKNPMYGKQHSEETRLKISESMKAYCKKKKAVKITIELF